MATYKFWLFQKEHYVNVADKIREEVPDFEFEDGVKYHVSVSEPCKVIEKLTKPELNEGVFTEYFYGKPKGFTYSYSFGDLWMFSDNRVTEVTVESIE